MDRKVMRHLEGYPIVAPVPVAWGDMDAFQHVNNVVFFRYFEVARIEYLMRVGFADRERPDGMAPILHSTSARFRMPLRYPDTAWAAARITEIQEDRVLMSYRVVSERAGEVAADGSGVVVSFDYPAGHKAPLPEDVRSAIIELEAAAGGSSRET